nr:PREDICTED: uncharacterized protein LOC105264525 [Fopius arisanus]
MTENCEELMDGDADLMLHESVFMNEGSWLSQADANSTQSNDEEDQMNSSQAQSTKGSSVDLNDLTEAALLQAEFSEADFNEDNSMETGKTKEIPLHIRRVADKICAFKALEVWMAENEITANNIDQDVMLAYFEELKNEKKGFQSVQTLALTEEQTSEFLDTAPDDLFLDVNVVLILAMFGACRRCELKKLSITDVTDKGNYLPVKLDEAKTDTSRWFVVTQPF